MLDESLRNLKDTLIEPLAKKLARVATPNQISLISLVAAVLSSRALAFRPISTPNWTALTFWTLNRLLDGLDGAVARCSGTSTLFGGLLDLCCDQIAYILLPVGLTLGNLALERSMDNSIRELVALAVMLSSFYVNIGVLLLLGGLLERRGERETLDKKTGRTVKTALIMPTGLIEGYVMSSRRFPSLIAAFRAETIIFYYLFLLFPRHLTFLYSLFAFLVVLTIGQRLYWAYRIL